ncbi:unnamed protein product [Acanthoscelides obtectus]|uniref:MADF domain-containing protein n=1 Tax=Acanthoscelides obtectus TaxID=200917 RepID=A0A9P0NYX7_ACAOB|nr:unnamed protein product [Acanthoscelides obtectus]CAK1671244.1 hypothetical protein AOBTE_LOCUS28179 [Acanthoscelides obtectus]
MEYFIECVRKHPCLWKVDSNEYKNNEIKEAAWRSIIADCDISDVKEAKCQWKKLRDGHRQALNKKKTTTGQAASMDIRLWKYEKQMDFLLPHLGNRQRSTATQQIIEADIDGGVDNFENIQAEENSELAVNDDFQQTTPNTQRNKRKVDKMTDYLQQEQKRRDRRSTDRDLFRRGLHSREKSMERKDTPLKKFFDSMYGITNELPPYSQVQVQRQIFNSVMDAHEANLQRQSRMATPDLSTQPPPKTYCISLPSSSD